ncbi:maleylpyruvate isomerase family mycothiol-dependent enzyme [Pseudonocardia alaniniphila]|uniref:Maleylpyruvate isomerase family mycothiol-dependent enzyme n=1 Tax=Pseudonocardia alaniniphila TaxID=75291 RepID=A0ABS9TV48_9PSEU|nr:maleylpyruvate isomerase family mycothiol-dependent enzyme [Pseudonocardia alaniniphila]MCH6172439.1 maleylpyruvate isomerase family mycothiol-dependent enzyme [Pseudonocardia alaniniphila]
MNTDVVYVASARERRRIADLIDELNADQLGTPSLCEGWTVRTVAAHLVAATTPSKLSFVGELLRHRGDAHATNDTIARRIAAEPAGEIATRLRRNADSRFAPPFVGARGPLTDVLVHGGDMRLPLGLPHAPDPAHVRPALEFVTTGRPVGFVPRGRLRGLRLVATDLDWTWGDGAAIEGRGIDLLMAACGRHVVLANLTGPGAAVLQDRLSPPNPA